MPSHLATFTLEDIVSIKEAAVTKTTKVDNKVQFDSTEWWVIKSLVILVLADLTPTYRIKLFAL